MFENLRNMNKKERFYFVQERIATILLYSYITFIIILIIVDQQTALESF